MRKTKIICTVGPATDKAGVLENMMLAGMNVARFNFSHATYDVHEKPSQKVVRVRETLGPPAHRSLDPKGPEI